jgi:CRISPR/Cas system-associated exonuclease Cas4 (RecB family)
MNKNNKISRSQIELFIYCPRCFWLDVKFKIKSPEKFSSGYIGNKYDQLLKNCFDKHRENNKTSEEIEKHELSLFSDIETLKT